MSDALKHIQTLVATGFLPQGILLSGANSEELNRAAALIAAQILNTERLDTHPDYIYVENSKVEDVRRMLSTLSLRSFGARVAVLAAAENLTTEAVNSLLKKIEEPNDQTYFIVTSSHEEKLLPTLRSRLMTFRLQAMEEQAGHELVGVFINSSLAERLSAVSKVCASEETENFLLSLYRREVAQPVSQTPQRLVALLQTFEYIRANVGASRALALLALKWN
jgi:DNA polymerase III delta prime subunit